MKLPQSKIVSLVCYDRGSKKKKGKKKERKKKNALSVCLTSILTALYWLVCFISRFRNNIILLQAVKNSITDTHLSHPTCVCGCVCVCFLFLFVCLVFFSRL